jgi:hypothetical protein
LSCIIDQFGAENNRVYVKTSKGMEVNAYNWQKERGRELLLTLLS